MEYDPNDQKVIDLLSKLKNDKSVYPSELLESRRRKYLQQAANLSLGLGVGTAFKKSMSGRPSGLPSTAGAWLEIALVGAIVVEASIAAYFYRHKLIDAIQTVDPTPTVEAAAMPPVASPLPAVSLAPTATVTLTFTATGTPVIVESSTTAAGGAQPEGGSSSGAGDQAGSTPAPDNNGGGNNGNDNGNNGNHYGQTKQPPKPTREPKATKAPKE